MRLRRNDKIRLFKMDNNKFEGRNLNDDVILDSENDYFIYMKNVNLKNGNIIEGRYLGELNDDNPIIDNHCKEVLNNGDQFIVDGKAIRTAKMIAVNNKTKIILIIASR